MKEILILDFKKLSNAWIIVFALNDKKGFEDLSQWIQEVDVTTGSLIPFFVVGNKCDLERVISEEEIKKELEKLKVKYYYEVSSKTGEGLENAIEKIVEILLLEKENGT